MKLLTLLLLTTSLLFSATKFEKTYVIYKKGDFKTSFTQFKYLAENEHDLDASYILGYMYEHGEGCHQDRLEAEKWYKLTARAYYFRDKENPNRDINKETLRLYHSIDKLDPETGETIKRYTQSLYNLKAHKINYFLPMSYRNDGEYAPTNGHTAKNIETEFQFSIKYNFATNLLGFNEIYSAAYTQHSFWQLYSESAYFRETNYNPELFVTLPISSLYDAKFVKGIRVAFAHESNGRGGLEERSWNYLSASTYFQYKYLFMELKLWYRLSDNFDYNPDLLEYLGHGNLRFILPYKKHMIQLMLRSNFSDAGAVELNYTYPALGRKDLYWYVKGFSGYGESLIDYNHYINKIGIGFSISR